MLELRSASENCNRPLPPDSAEAMIGTFACTFCRTRVEKLLENVGPNCGGGFLPRPSRPKTNWQGGDYLGNYPANRIRRHRTVDPARHRQFAKTIKSIPPERR